MKIERRRFQKRTRTLAAGIVLSLAAACLCSCVVCLGIAGWTVAIVDDSLPGKFSAPAEPIVEHSSSSLDQSFSPNADSANPFVVGPSTSLVFDLRQNDGGMNFSQNMYFEVEVKPGDSIAPPSKSADADCQPFLLTSILDSAHVKVRVSEGLQYGTPLKHQLGGDEVTLAAGESLEAWTPTVCAGTRYTLSISDLREAPKVRADSQEIIAAIEAHASVTKDGVGTIQVVGPLGTVGHRQRTRQLKNGQRQLLSDDDLRTLAKLNNLRQLAAVGTSVTDSGAAYLKDMPRLMILSLNGSRITDAALANLSHLTRLETLDLSETQVGDAGLRHLGALHRLKTLNLSSTNVSDAGIETLIKLKSLSHLGIDDTRITSAGIWELLHALPQCFAPQSYGGYWGKLRKPNATVGPEQFASASRDREKKLFKLLLLRCNLRANEDDDVIEASVPVVFRGSYGMRRYRKQEVDDSLRLLATLGGVKKLSLQPGCIEPEGILDDQTAALLSALRRVEDLDLSRCWFSDAGWMRFAEMSGLTRLNLTDAKIPGEVVRNLHKALPRCNIVGRPSSDEKFPPPNLAAEVVLAQLRRGFPGKSDAQIVDNLRNYLPIDEPVSGAASEWFAARLEAAKKQSVVVRMIESAKICVHYQDEYSQVGDKIVRQNIVRPKWLRETVGDDFFRPVILIDGGAQYGRAEDAPPSQFAWLRHLPDLPTVRSLQISNTPSAQMKHLSGLPELRTLTVYSGQITGEDLKHLCRLSHLKSLDLSFCSKFTDAGTESFEGLTQLHTLNLWGTRIADAGLQHFSGLIHLEELDLRNTLVDGPGLDYLKDLPELRVLRLSKNDMDVAMRPINDSAVPHVAKLKRLQELDLCGDISNAGLESIEKMTRLKSLDLGGNRNIGDAGMKHLAMLANLQMLSVANTPITDDGLRELVHLNKLQTLDIEGTRITKKGLYWLKHLPELTHLIVHGNQLNGIGLQRLKALPKLKNLTVYDTEPGDTKRIRQSLPNCAILTYP